MFDACVIISKNKVFSIFIIAKSLKTYQVLNRTIRIINQKQKTNV